MINPNPPKFKQVATVPVNFESTLKAPLATRRSLISLEDKADVRKEGADWDKPIEFLFTCISYAVGLGNVWRFPYLCYKNGGGAFLFPYCIMLILVGLPVFFLELSFGQFASLGPLSIWVVSPLFKGIGYSMITVTLVISLYYNVVIAQCLFFFISSFTTGDLPWMTCGNAWNTEHCVIPSPNGTAGCNSTITDCGSTANRTNSTEKTIIKAHTKEGMLGIGGTNTEEFYYNNVLHQSPYGINDMGSPQLYMSLCLLLAWAIVVAGLIKGIKSLGKISYFTALFPYCMLTALLIRGLTLEGAMDGVIFYLTPDFKKLMDPQVWQAAATQLFYNLSCATGGLIAMASFNRFKNNCLRDALIVPTLNVLTSVFAGLVVFSVLGFMAYEKKTTVADVVASGPGLVFIVYPEALAKLPGAPIWAVLFFLMMLSLGFGSELSLVESVLTAFQDDLHTVINSRFKKTVYRVVCCLLFFGIGLFMVTRGGIYVLDLVDHYVAFISLLVVCLLEVIALVWVYGFPKLRISEDIEMMLGHRPPMFFEIMWRYVTPLTVTLLLIFTFISVKNPKMSIGGVEEEYPDWAIAIGWIVAIIPLVPIPIWLACNVYFFGGFRPLLEELKPLPNWGPMKPINRTGRYAMNAKEEEARMFTGGHHDEL